MANGMILTAVAVLALGGGAAYFLLQNEGSGDGLDSAGRALLRDVAAERQKDPVDRASCRKLLQEFRAHPAHETSRALIRGRAWLEYLVGRSNQAWDLIESNLDVEAAAEDYLLGALVLERRFADTGQDDLAHRGATYAQSHFAATNERSSLFLAWQLQARRENLDRREELAKLLTETFPDSLEARLVKLLVNYPHLREEDAGTEAELRKLEAEFQILPVELDLALAWFEVQREETLNACMERVERVLATYQSSLTGRSLGGMVALRLQQWEKARTWLRSLLGQYPDHRYTKLWKQALATAEQQLEKKNG